MGQFLTIGIATKVGVSKKALNQHQLTPNTWLEKMQQQRHFEAAIYKIVDDKDYLLYQLDTALLKNQLPDLVAKLSTTLYDRPATYFDRALKALKDRTTDEWLDWVESQGYEAFQLDTYGTTDYWEFDADTDAYLRLHYRDIIMLSFEGKISMKTYGKQFRFFEHCIQQTFDQLSLAKAIKVYIMG